jgi:hypothetical protein
MGGNLIKESIPIEKIELLPTYNWVIKNILSLFGLTEKDCIPIGSFMKKNEPSGDIDIAIDCNKFLKEGLKFNEITESFNLILEENGIHSVILKGFDTISIAAPICGNIKRGYAQIDLMPILDLNWAKFIYHSPNLSENESNYKGAVRNALLLAIVSESTKKDFKLNEGKIEEYSSLAIRFNTGLWNIKKSFLGKSGKIIKIGVPINEKFITKNPQDIIDISFGKGYKIQSANSFETIWEIIHKKDFIHKDKLNEIMSKFKVNLKSMMQNIPKEAIKKYPQIFNGGYMSRTHHEIIKLV